MLKTPDDADMEERLLILAERVRLLEATKENQRFLMDELLKLAKESFTALRQVTVSEKISIMQNHLLGSELAVIDRAGIKKANERMDRLRSAIMRGDVNPNAAMGIMRRILEETPHPQQPASHLMDAADIAETFAELSVPIGTVHFDPDVAKQVKEEGK